MSRFFSITGLMLLISIAARAQMGRTSIGTSNVGNDKLTGFVIGRSATPKCLFPGSCAGSCPVYIFTGTGNWDIPGNWSANVLPPDVLPGCYEIIINPFGNTECLLNIASLILSPGSKLTVMPGKKFRIPGELVNKMN